MTILKKINYPFQGRNLFKEPETYFYSDCSSLTYVADYIGIEKLKSMNFHYQRNIISQKVFTPIHAKPFITSSDLLQYPERRYN